MKKNESFGKIIRIILFAMMSILVFAGCKDKERPDLSSKHVQEQNGGEKTGNDEADAEKGLSAKEGDDATDTDDVPPEVPDEAVDEKWIKVLEENGTFYDAIYALPKIMEEDPGNHPDNIKVPDGIIKDNLDYYIPEFVKDDGNDSGRAPVNMSEVVGRWIPLFSKYQGIETDYTWAKKSGQDFHLILNDDGTGKCNLYEGEQNIEWDENKIVLPKPIVQECTYLIDGENLVMSREMAPGMVMSWTFERDGEGSDAATAKEEPEQFLGHKLNGAKVYRLARTFEGKNKKDATTDDPELSPKDHFVVIVETDEEVHNGYGYMREGKTDTALYYQSDRGIFKLINENTMDRSNGMGRTKFEMEDDDRLLRLWPGYQSTPDKYYEYELSDGEEAPVSRLPVGPNPDRNFEIPEGTHENAGTWRLDRIFNYLYTSADPLMETEAPLDDVNVYGKDTRKYDADIWYVLREDGTGYMRVWDKYFEVVWSDQEQYYYDISGRHKMGTEVGEMDYDALFTRLFRDELNEVPEYPDELKDK